MDIISAVNCWRKYEKIPHVFKMPVSFFFSSKTITFEQNKVKRNKNAKSKLV